MNNYYYYIGGAILLVIIILIILLLFKGKKNKNSALRKKENNNIEGDPYIVGLILMIDKDYEKAYKYFKKVVMQDSDNIDAYIRLGILARKKGEYEKATNIHQSLTVRTSLTSYQEKLIYRELGEDYIEEGRLERAISVLNEYLHLTYDEEYFKKTASLYIKTDNLSGLKEFLQTFSKSYSQDFLLPYYLYTIDKGKDNLKEQENMLAKMKKYAKNHPYLLYLEGKLLSEKQEVKKALKKYIECIEKKPQYYEICLPKISTILLDQGEYERIVPILEKLETELPEDIYIKRELADIYRKKGSIALSKDMYNKEENIILLVGKMYLYKIPQEAMEILNSIDMLIKKTHYTCPVCGKESSTFEWICKECGNFIEK